MAEYYSGNPCETCDKAETCDGWEAAYCCALCIYNGAEHCEDCDSMDI
jgi:hypothetical protein